MALSHSEMVEHIRIVTSNYSKAEHKEVIGGRFNSDGTVNLQLEGGEWKKEWGPDLWDRHYKPEAAPVQSYTSRRIEGSARKSTGQSNPACRPNKPASSASWKYKQPYNGGVFNFDDEFGDVLPRKFHKGPYPKDISLGYHGINWVWVIISPAIIMLIILIITLAVYGG